MGERSSFYIWSGVVFSIILISAWILSLFFEEFFYFFNPGFIFYILTNMFSEKFKLLVFIYLIASIEMIAAVCYLFLFGFNKRRISEITNYSSFFFIFSFAIISFYYLGDIFNLFSPKGYFEYSSLIFLPAAFIVFVLASAVIIISFYVKALTENSTRALSIQKSRTNRTFKVR